MKLLYCKSCGDIFSLGYREKSCSCGNTKGKYFEDGLHAVYSGDQSIPLGISNPSFHDALHNQPEEGMGKNFEAFIIPKECKTFVKTKTK